MVGRLLPVVNGEPGPRLQNPGDFLAKAFLIFDIHADMQHVGCVKHCVLEGHREGRRSRKLDTIVQADPFAQAIACLDIVRRQIDPRDPEQYFAKMQADEALPGMPTQADWQHNALGMGDIITRKWLAMEMLAIVCSAMWVKLQDHETRLTAAGL